MKSRRSSSSSGPAKADSNEAKITRRGMAALFAAVPMMAQEPPQSQKQKTPRAPGSLDQALADVRETSEKLRKIHLPATIEPAFSFKV